MILENKVFLENHLKYFAELRDRNELYDVTLACDDHVCQAHKIIISASSLFFRNVISQSNHDKPFIYLKGVNKQDLESIIEFMYSGKAQVEKNNIVRFLGTAADLQIDGLSIDACGQASNSVTEDCVQTSTTKKKKPNKKKLYKVNQTAAIKLELNEPPLNNSVKQESDFLSSNETSKLNESCNPEVKNLLEIEIGQKIQGFIAWKTLSFCGDAWTVTNSLEQNRRQDTMLRFTLRDILILAISVEPNQDQDNRWMFISTKSIPRNFSLLTEFRS